MSHVIKKDEKRLLFSKKLSKKERAAATAAAAATAEEFSQSIQAPSSTHGGTTYPVREIPHHDKKFSTNRSEGLYKNLYRKYNITANEIGFLYIVRF